MRVVFLGLAYHKIWKAVVAEVLECDRVKEQKG